MTTKLIQELERRRLLQAKLEYEKEGYSVILKPSGIDLPEFLSGFEPNMIAHKGDVHVVVEVKSQPTLTTAKYLPELVKSVNSIPGWRVDLIVTNPKEIRLIDEGAKELELEKVHARINTVQHLVSIEQLEAALLLSWSVVEGTLRLIALRDEVELESDNSGTIVHDMLYWDLISIEDYYLFREAVQTQRLLIHGLNTPDIEAAFVVKVIDSVLKLLESVTSSQLATTKAS